MPRRSQSREFKTLRKDTRALLDKAEGRDVDFKRDARAVEQGDLVAFANSPAGGTILVGVDEIVGEGGVQRGKVIGCAVGDRERLLIADKAAQCHTSVEVRVIVENTSDKPILRVDIPSGPHKPYCTARGTYRIRGEGKNQPLLPPGMLSLLMETQAEAFLTRFSEATSGLETHLEVINRNAWSGFLRLDSSVDELTIDVQRRMEEIQRDLEVSFRHISDVSENANTLADESMMQASLSAEGVEHATSQLDEVLGELSEVREGLQLVLKSLGIEDPATTRLKRQAKMLLSVIFERSPDIGLDEAASEVTTIMGLPIGSFVHRIACDEFPHRVPQDQDQPAERDSST